MCLQRLCLRKTTYTFQNCYERINKVKSETEALFEEGKIKTIDMEKAISNNLVELLDRYNEKYDIMAPLLNNFCDFTLFTFENPESTKVGLHFILKYMQNKKFKDSIPQKELVKAAIGIKNKHSRHPDVPRLCDELLKFNDVNELLLESITSYEKIISDSLNEESKKLALNKLNDIRGLVTLSDIKEEKLLPLIERIMKPSHKLLAKFDKDIPVLDGITSVINKIAEKGEKSQSKLVNQESQDLLTVSIFWSTDVLLNAGKEKSDSYLHAYAKVMNDKIMEPYGKKQVDINLSENKVVSKKEEEKLDDSMTSKSKVWGGKEKQIILNTINGLMNSKNPKKLAMAQPEKKNSNCFRSCKLKWD